MRAIVPTSALQLCFFFLFGFDMAAALLPSVTNQDSRVSVKSKILDTSTSANLLKEALRNGDDYTVNEIVVKLSSEKVSYVKSSSRIATGSWKIRHAPHISLLEKVLFTKFDVSYIFPDSRQPYSLISNVRYTSPLFGTGHLSTAGKYEMTQSQECKIVWDKIWWDIKREGPSSYDDIKSHVLPSIIQFVGKAAFVEGVSKFPIEYLDSDVCIFRFELFGTTICALKN